VVEGAWTQPRVRTRKSERFNHKAVEVQRVQCVVCIALSPPLSLNTANSGALEWGSEGEAWRSDQGEGGEGGEGDEEEAHVEHRGGRAV